MQRSKEELEAKKPHELLNEARPIHEENLRYRDELLKKIEVLKLELKAYKDNNKVDNEVDLHTCEDSQVRLTAKTFGKLKQMLHKIEDDIALQAAQMLTWEISQELHKSQDLRDKLTLKT